MPLDERTASDAKPAERAYKLWDSRGLYLLVKPSGAKYWRLKYRRGGKEKLVSLGVYPAISLEAARGKRDQARDAIAHGIDPVESRRRARESAPVAAPPECRAMTSSDGGLSLETPSGVLRLTKPQTDALAAFIAAVVQGERPC
jgi:hypothetical protein